MYWRIFKPSVFGAKLVVFNSAGEVLLIRHSYGRSDLYMLPGGGIGRGKDAETAAIRELAEEVHCAAENVKFVAKYFDDSKGAKNTVTVFTATTHDKPQIDGKEIVEARFFPADALPPKTSRSTRHRIAEVLGEQEINGDW